MSNTPFEVIDPEKNDEKEGKEQEPPLLLKWIVNLVMDRVQKEIGGYGPKNTNDGNSNT